jgi:hypothetical protein
LNLALAAFLMRVSMSAIGSLIVIVLSPQQTFNVADNSLFSYDRFNFSPASADQTPLFGERAGD